MDKKLKELILKSGNNLHTEVADLLKKLGWDVEISNYYYDDTADKPREIDIVASRVETVNYSNSSSDFKVFLFIECKYLTEEVAFRIYDNSKENGRSAILSHNFSVDILEETNTALAHNHHYVSIDKIGKLFDSKNNNEIFNAFTSTAKSLMFFKERRNVKGMFYPIVVYDGIPGIYEIKDNDFSDLDNLKSKETLVFHFNYSYRSAISNQLKHQSFCIDFVHKSKLEEFIHKILEPEIKQVNKFGGFLIMKGRNL